MARFQRRLWFGLVVLFPMLCLAEQREVGIGGIFDLSTAAGGVWGRDERDGFLLAIEDFQRAYPEIKVRHAVEDSEYSNTKSLSALQKLISVDKFSFIIGPTWEPFTATSQVCERRKVLCFAPSNYSQYFYEKPLKYSFTAFFKETGYATSISKVLVDEKLTKTALLATESEYFELLTRTFLQTTENVSSIQRMNPAERDFRAMIGKVPADVDSVVLFLDGNGQGYSFLRQWIELRRDRPNFFSHDAIAYEPQLEAIKRMPISLRISNLFFPEQEKKRWAEKFQGRYGRAPQAPSGSIAYDETMLVLSCAAKSAVTADAVASCIRSTSGYSGLSGELSFEGGQGVTSREFVIETLVP